MQNRKAIILSLGMLLEKVDVDSFIGKQLKKAKEENAAFEFTREIQAQVFSLAENFNLGKITSEEYKAQTLQCLGVKDGSEFWSDWNLIITIGNIVEKLKQLQSIANQHNAIIYLSSDTNAIHLELIQKLCREKSVEVKADKQLIFLNQFLLYASCQFGKTRQALSKQIIDDIKSKQFNKPDEIILITGNPGNIKHPAHKVVAERDYKAISSMCEESGVSIKLHDNALEETFSQIFMPEKSAMNMFKVS